MPASGRRATIGVGRTEWFGVQVREVSSQIVLVTGASSGIGAAVAREFVARGHTVYGTSRNPDTVANPVPGHVCVWTTPTTRPLTPRSSRSGGSTFSSITPVNRRPGHRGHPMADIEDLFAKNVFAGGTHQGEAAGDA